MDISDVASKLGIPIPERSEGIFMGVLLSEVSTMAQVRS